jgi:two-component system, LytTR family, response regulator
MHALIVDDERLARLELRRLLRAHPEIDVIGEANGASDAEDKIAQLRPNLIFLDVQMPARTGFELLESLRNPPRVIFTTAHDEHALRAFEFGAVDYLLKPIDPERLTRSLSRVLSSTDAPAPDAPAGGATLREEDQVFLKDGERCWFVRVGEIRLLESEGNYARAYFGENRPLLPRTLQALESRLDPKCFLRVSRRHLVNLRFIRKVEPWFDGGLTLRLAEGDPEIKVTRRRALSLRERLTL